MCIERQREKINIGRETERKTKIEDTYITRYKERE
jgi:hypothetical protein